ncbi:MAG: hypothetical protein ACI9VN_003346 [Patescibacteria group bacterium]|jgi:hypothetical protein
MANQEGVGAGWVQEPLICREFCILFFRLKKYVPEGPAESLKLKGKSHKKRESKFHKSQKKGFLVIFSGFGISPDLPTINDRVSKKVYWKLKNKIKALPFYLLTIQNLLV